MRRAEFVFLVMIGVAIAFEPIIHTHPLSQTSQSACAVCVNVLASAAALFPAPSAPRLVVSAVVSPGVSSLAQPIAMPLASRAPPAA